MVKIKPKCFSFAKNAIKKFSLKMTQCGSIPVGSIQLMGLLCMCDILFSGLAHIASTVAFVVEVPLCQYF